MSSLPERATYNDLQGGKSGSWGEFRVQRGVLNMVIACTMFGLMYFWVTLMRPLTGQEIFGWRMMINAPATTMILLMAGERDSMRRVLSELRAQPWRILVVLLNVALLSTQQILYMWAPNNDRALEVSMGYFLLPLTIVVAGRVLFGDPLTRLQKLAAASAAVGVVLEFLRVQRLTWEIPFVALGFTAYFASRRRFGVAHPGYGWLEMHLIVPIAVACVLTGPTGVEAVSGSPKMWLLILGIGLISATAFICYLAASRSLNFVLFGLLGYLEPMWLVVVSLLIGEVPTIAELAGYVPIALAVVLLVVEGIRRVCAESAAVAVESEIS